SSAMFDGKEQLKKQPSDAYDLPLLDYLLIKQQEEGLTNAESETLIAGYQDNQTLKSEAQQYASVYFSNEKAISYPDKQLLKRSVLLPFFRKQVLHRAATVAAIFAVGSSLWLLRDSLSVDSQTKLAQTRQVSESNQSLLSEAKPATKIVEKHFHRQPPISNDSLLKMAKDPMRRNKEKPTQKADSATKSSHPYQDVQALEMLASANLPTLKTTPINAFEQGLNAMMPQYMNNNKRRQELAEIYKKIEADQQDPSLNIALVENGVKFVNWLSKDRLELQKQYDEDENLVAYQLKGEKIQISRKAK
ncbi:MAG: hypothetical protein JEZ14_10295, partial [Marinilabiliaceae bacterium]|nr:hypothetical protein [Marinilabiliaceae bacterium]